MTEQDLSEFDLLDDFTITEIEQRLEFEGWYDGNCVCDPSNILCPPPPPPIINEACELNEPCGFE